MPNSRPPNVKLAAALKLARRGVPVFPLKGKTQPLTKHSFQDATTDLDQVRRWWRKWPDADVGVPTGAASGVIAIDADTYKPEFSEAALDALDLPPTRKHGTPHGGVQYVIRHPGGHIPNSIDKLGPAIDVRGDGGYTVWPPSTGYTLLNGERAAECPPVLAVRLNGASPASPPTGPPKRHDTLRTASVKLAAAGVEPVDRLTMLMALDAASPNPIAKEGRADEIRRLAESAEQFAPEERCAHDVEARARHKRIDKAADRLIAAENGGPRFVVPKPGLTLKDALAEPRSPLSYTVDRLHTAGGNTLLVAQYKTGKTTLLANLLKAAADGTPFLGEFAMEITGRIAFFNYELTREMFYDWLDDIEVEHPERVAYPWNLRGQALTLGDDAVRAELIDWLQEEEVGFWIVDPAARAMRGLVESENDNTQVGAFTDLLDEIKGEAGVRDLVLSTHMGRAFMGEDAERSRGATRLEDWMDHGWYLTKDGKSADSPRALRAMGRDVDVAAIDLSYDMLSRQMLASGRSRSERRASDATERLLAFLHGHEGMTTTEVRDVVKGIDSEHFSGAVMALEKLGWIRRGPLEGAKGAGLKEKRMWVTEDGRARRVRTDRTGG